MKYICTYGFQCSEGIYYKFNQIVEEKIFTELTSSQKRFFKQYQG